MASPAKLFKIGCAIVAGLAALIVAGIAVLAFFSKEPPPFAERLSALPSTEREALEAVAKAAGVAVSELRDIGAGAPLDDARNFRAVAVERGHVRLLSLQNLKLEPLPSLSVFTHLEQLSLRGSALKAAPDLAGCVALKTLDLSKNEIEQLQPGHLPAGLDKLDLSENRIRDFEPLIDLPLRLLNLSKNPIAKTPSRLPKSREFRIDLTDCPAAHPPGYLQKWSFKIRQAGVVGQHQTSTGLVTLGKFEAGGTWKVVPQLTTVELLTAPNARDVSRGPIELEVTVAEGRLRVYLTEAAETRGEWFAKGYVKGTDTFFKPIAKLYADAEPGRPARLHGSLEHFNTQPYYFYIEPQPGPPVKEMTYRAWQN